MSHHAEPGRVRMPRRGAEARTNGASPVRHVAIEERHRAVAARHAELLGSRPPLARPRSSPKEAAAEPGLNAVHPPKRSPLAMPQPPRASGAVIQCVGEEEEKRFNIRGAEKWREFIDVKDSKRGPRAYDEDVKGPGNRVRKGEKGFYESMVVADAYVAKTLGQPMTAAGYKRIHDMTVAHPSAKKGGRTGEIEWGLREGDKAAPTDAQLAILKGHGTPLEYRQEIEEPRRHMMVVPAMSEGEIVRRLEVIFDQYHDSIAEAHNADARLLLIAQTYQKLEALHAFRDGTSRTNHLILNKLLVENEMYPVALEEPNSLEFSDRDWAEKLREACERTVEEAEKAKETPSEVGWNDQPAKILYVAKTMGQLPKDFDKDLPARSSSSASGSAAASSSLAPTEKKSESPDELQQTLASVDENLPEGAKLTEQIRLLNERASEELRLLNAERVITNARPVDAQQLRLKKQGQPYRGSITRETEEPRNADEMTRKKLGLKYGRVKEYLVYDIDPAAKQANLVSQTRL